MAELVQKNIESFIPELEQMERVGLADRDEVREILRRRKRFEYRLRRRKKSKEDYLTYIQYELNLYELLQKRRARLRIGDKKPEIDFIITKRINRLFKKAVLMFSGDTKLWLSHISFCVKMGWNHVVGTLYTRMLNLHSHKPEMWVAAAKWHLESNASPELARKLLQKGLQFNNKSSLLWHEYFRMELIFVDKVRKRKEVLGIGEKKDDDMEVEDAVLEAKIPALIYDAAVKSIPDVDFALSFLPICDIFKFADQLAERILEDIQTRHPNKEQVWDVVARRLLASHNKRVALPGEESVAEFTSQKGVAAARAVFEQALERLPSETMWKLYIQFSLELLEKSNSEKQAAKRLRQVLSLMERASSEELLTFDHHQEWVKLLQSCNVEKDTLACARAAVQRWPSSTEAWLLLLELLIVTTPGTEDVLKTFEEALGAIPKQESLPIWKRALEWMSSACPESTIPFFEKALFYPPTVCLYVKEKLLECYYLYHGYKAARKFYKRMLRLKPLSLSFFQHMIDIENSSASPDAERLRTYFEHATAEFGETNVDLWMKYVLFELKHPQGKPEQAGVLYHRAVKTLQDDLTDQFISSYSLVDPSKV
ncbi:hypothetical protein V5799_023552 [Amblyomma americanum]|uniref:U3 small nucleolar rna-associated protein 6 n=1 Tax=Amblyomma americanum TaxID=6943 RepID=A0AAQ4FH85_AMBAM